MILVTGAAGYLGQKVIAGLMARGPGFWATSRDGTCGSACDLTDELAVRRLLQAVAPTRIIHCAAVVPTCPEDYHSMPFAMLSMRMTLYLCVAACPITFASSLTAADPSRSAYAAGKRCAEMVLEARRHAGDRIIRLPGLYGLPRRSGDLYEDARTGRARGGDPSWEVMHVIDAAEWLISGELDLPDGTAVMTRALGRWQQFVEDVRQDLIVRTP